MALLKGRSKVGVIFSGGPAPAANSVISAAALSFLDNNIPIIGFINGYKNLIDFDKSNPKLRKGSDFVEFDSDIGDIRNRRGVYIKTARANPGKMIKGPDDLNDVTKTKPLQNVLDAFEYMDIGLLISIGGDDTLRTGNLISQIGFPVIHVPKTIDNDYFGIPWTFGFWTSVEIAKNAVHNLQSDSESTGSYFIAEIMGRKAGWLTYAAGIGGEAVKMIAVEDLPPGTGDIDIDAICNDIVDTILARENVGKNYGVICVAEGLADRLPDFLRPKEKDSFGHTVLGKAEIGKVIADSVTRFYEERTGKAVKIISKQIGYETRTARPVSFDVVLGSALGYGAYKLFSEKKINHMVSVEDNFNIVGIPFEDLIDPTTLTTKVRPVDTNSDFFHLKNALTFRR